MSLNDPWTDKCFPVLLSQREMAIIKIKKQTTVHEPTKLPPTSSWSKMWKYIYVQLKTSPPTSKSLKRPFFFTSDRQEGFVVLLYTWSEILKRPLAISFYLIKAQDIYVLACHWSLQFCAWVGICVPSLCTLVPEPEFVFLLSLLLCLSQNLFPLTWLFSQRQL